MTELQLTSPDLKRLFDVIDLEPMPQSEALRRALDYWRTRRADAVYADIEKIDPTDLPRFAPYLFLYETEGVEVGDSTLIYAGGALSPVTGQHPLGSKLSEASEQTYIKHAQPLFALALERGEAVCGVFAARFEAAGELNVEILAAPVKDADRRGIFGAIATRHPEHGWEDQPVPMG